MLMFPFQLELCWSLWGDSEPPTDGAKLSLSRSLSVSVSLIIKSWVIIRQLCHEVYPHLNKQSCDVRCCCRPVLSASHSVSHSTRWQPNDFTQRVRLKSSSGGCHIAGSLCLCVGWHKLTFEMHLDRWEGRARAHGQKSLLKERVFYLQEYTPFWQITLRCN